VDIAKKTTIGGLTWGLPLIDDSPKLLCTLYVFAVQIILSLGVIESNSEVENIFHPDVKFNIIPWEWTFIGLFPGGTIITSYSCTLPRQD
jgi:hypothetical protein